MGRANDAVLPVNAGEFLVNVPERKVVLQITSFRLLDQKESSMDGTLKRIFGGVFKDLAEAPRDTSLRRAVLRHLEGGNVLRDTGGFILRDAAPPIQGK